MEKRQKKASEFEIFMEKMKEKARLERHAQECIKKMLNEQKLPKIVDLAIECSPAFKDEKILCRIKDALKVLAVTSSPKMLQEALFASKGYRQQMFGTEWELSVFVAQGLVLDLLEGRKLFYPRAEDIRGSQLFFNTVLKYIPEGMDMDEFEKVKHSWVEELIECHPELT